MRRGRNRPLERSREGGGLKRLVVPAVLALAAYYAVFGGEYSVFELRQARADIVREADDLERVHAAIDSLQAWADSLRSDPATIERIAREDFGMIREGETLYRFVEAEAEGAPAPQPER